MKRIIPLFLFVLFLSGCARNATHSPSLSAMKTAPSNEPLRDDLNWQYYIKKDGLYRTDENTGDIIKINNSNDATDIIITEDWVYYKDNNLLYRMDNENRIEQISSDECQQLCLSGDMLYYINSSGINRMNLNGSGKELIFQCTCNAIVVTDKYVFYALNVPENDELNNLPGAEDGPLYMGELHRVGLSGEDDLKVADMVTALSVNENVVYYADGLDASFYALNPETLEKATIDKVKMVGYAYFADSYVFFMTHTDRCLYRMSLKDGTLTMLAERWPYCYGVLDGYIYVGINTFDSDEHGLYKIKIDGVDLEKVE